MDKRIAVYDRRDKTVCGINNDIHETLKDLSPDEINKLRDWSETCVIGDFFVTDDYLIICVPLTETRLTTTEQP